MFHDAYDMFHDMLCTLCYDMLVQWSGFGRVLQRSQNEVSTPQDPQQAPKPKYEAAALQGRLSKGYPNSYARG
jgi:hypothetical protein